MLNLLPKDQRGLLRREYVRRFIVVTACMLGLLCMSCGVALLPSFFMVKMKRDLTIARLSALKESPKAQDRDRILGIIKDLEQSVSAISLTSGGDATTIIDSALLLKTPGVSILSISYAKKDKAREVSLGGVARSREELVNFSKNVKASNWSVTSDIPLSNLANEHDIHFLITISSTSTSDEKK